MDSNFKQKSKQSLIIKSDEIHIWSTCFLDSEMNLYYLSSLLSKDEQERAGSFRFSRDQKRFIMARGILRCLLAGYLEKAPQTIELMYGLWGKPCLSQEKSLHFNVSHSGDYALYAVTLDYKIGVDLEYIDKNLELGDMALSVFSPLELTHWQNLEAEERVDLFFKYWVCKEAFLKASGKGWLNSEKEMPHIKDHCDNDLSNPGLTYPYCFECIPGYASALYVEGPSLRLIHYAWNPDLLQKN